MSRTARRGRRGRAASRSRGQTNIDFVVGIVVFLLAVSFVVAAVPQLLAPYENQETPVVAERVASTLADSLLVDGDEPGTLDTECTGVFFDVPGATGCSFGGATLTERVGVEPTYRVNVTLRWNVTGDASPEVLCYNGGDVGACATGASDQLAVGPPASGAQRSVASERRTVVVADRPATLQVRVW
jgi:hypothetical protein